MEDSWISVFCFFLIWISSGDVESGKKLHTIPGGRKGTENQHVGHTAHILCMAVSSDAKYLVRSPAPACKRTFMLWHLSVLFVSVGHWWHEQADNDLGSRNMQTCLYIHRTQRPRVGEVPLPSTQQHGLVLVSLWRLLISRVHFSSQGLSFRRGTHDLYSASHDRSVKVWNVDENAYVETLWAAKQSLVSPCS